MTSQAPVIPDPGDDDGDTDGDGSAGVALTLSGVCILLSTRRRSDTRSS